MQKEYVVVLAQLLSTMKEAVDRLETAKNKKEMDEINSAKQDILNLQSQINKML